MKERAIWMVGGLVMLALGVALLLEARLGLPPWDVLIFGSARLVGVSPVLTRVVLVAFLLVVIRSAGERTGIRVLLVPVVFGPMVSAWLTVVPTPGYPLWRVSALTLGVLLSGLGLGGYVSGRLLVGPSDSVCELLAQRSSRPLWQARMVVEGAVLVLGILAGGVAGIGTVLYAFGSGPVMHATLVNLDRSPTSSGHSEDEAPMRGPD